MNKMTWDEYKESVKQFANYPKENEEQYLELGLRAEAGEVYGVEAKYYRGDYDMEEMERRLRKECGDVLWFAAMMENCKHDFLTSKVHDTFYRDGDECREILANVFRVIDFYEWDIEEIYSENIAKLTDRLKRNKIQGDGDDR